MSVGLVQGYKLEIFKYIYITLPSVKFKRNFL